MIAPPFRVMPFALPAKELQFLQTLQLPADGSRCHGADKNKPHAVQNRVIKYSQKTQLLKI